MNRLDTAWRRMVPSLLATGLLMSLFLAPTVLAQYVETLGPSTAVLVPGTGTATAGTGLFDDGEGTISIDIPAGVTVDQVLLYWGGRDNLEQDDEVLVDGTPVTGTLIGTAALSQRAKAFAFRADITGLVTLTPGAVTAVEITGFGAPDASNTIASRDGASIVAILNDGTTPGVIDIRDGADFAWDRPGQPADEQVTVPQTFVVAAAAFDRTANMFFFVGDTEASRPDSIAVTVDGSLAFGQRNFFVAADGEQWSNQTVDVLIPAGATTITVEVFSGPRPPRPGEGSAESLTWNAGGFYLPPSDDGGPGCTYTQGGYKNYEQHPDRWPQDVVDNGLDLGGVVYSFSELQDWLDTAVRGDKTISMAHQLIAAKLNVLNGADPTDLGTTIADADQWLADHGGVGSGQRQWDGGEVLKNTLDAFNNGDIGPGHCDDNLNVNDVADANATSVFNEEPQAFSLDGAYPNPFTAQTTLRFQMDTAASVRLSVYDVMGREVAVLVDEALPAGEHQIAFDAHALASGTYLYRLVTPEGIITKRMMLTR